MPAAGCCQGTTIHNAACATQPSWQCQRQGVVETSHVHDLHAQHIGHACGTNHTGSHTRMRAQHIGQASSACSRHAHIFDAGPALRWFGGCDRLWVGGDGVDKILHAHQHPDACVQWRVKRSPLNVHSVASARQTLIRLVVWGACRHASMHRRHRDACMYTGSALAHPHAYAAGIQKKNVGRVLLGASGSIKHDQRLRTYVSSSTFYDDTTLPYKIHNCSPFVYHL